MRDIKELRDEIDIVDKELVKLFERRMAIVEEVAAYKIENDFPLKDAKREKALISKNVSFLENHKYDRLLRVFFKDLMEYSRTHQNELMRESSVKINRDFNDIKVAYQGVDGSFSSIALNMYFGKNIEKQNVLSFEDAFLLLQDKVVNYIVLPIENSSTGAINEVYDLLKKYQVSIVGEVYVPIVHNLIGNSDTTLETISEVYSHEQGFKQSVNFLNNYDWKQYNYYNTAKSVEFVSEANRSDFAAIGSEEAANVYGLNIIKPSIQDSNHNSTRFIVLSKETIADENSNKISLLLRLSHEANSLYNVLSKISKYNVNMLKIESRPVIDKPWEYIFYIDLEGSLLDEQMKKLLQEMEDASHFMLLLGNYYSDRCKDWRK